MSVKNPTEPRVAIVHDWLVGGGAERVVLELHRMFPEAPIYTSYATKEWRKQLDDKVVTGWLQHFGRLRKYLTLGRIWWFTHLDFSGYDLVISSSGNGEAKSIRVPEGVKHVCYCHAPTHYYWRHYDRYMSQPGFGFFNPLARLGLRVLVDPLRKWDKQHASTRPEYYIANSTHTAGEIKTFYGRESKVIWPPIDIERFKNVDYTLPKHGFITVGRQVPYKYTEIIIEACNELGLPLTVVGRGPEHDKLASIAGPTVRFRTNASDEEVVRLMATSEAFIFAAFEDFGITPVEAMAAGTPVIAFGKGGALDYVAPGKTGEFFKEQTVESLVNVLRQFNSRSYDPRTIKSHVKQFSPKAFQTSLQKLLKTI